ncbi:MAG TPA: glycosyltransferase family 39 protein [Vicinamibacterales bacterium]|nr:glycosyltransferase family 39 protein [Vicinamibacterales bacterium]
MSFWKGRAARLEICLVLWLATGAYLLPFVDRGWIAHDDGMLGQAAERVMAGELPHRDFYDPYTGGLAYLHALGFKILGVRLVSLRWLLFAATLAWVPVVYFLAARFVSPISAALVTAVAVAWSVPNYFASMPSYYNLFLATFGTAALFRHIERGGRRWLVLAGCCGGLSFLVKSVGIFFLVAGGLFLLFRAQIQSRRDAEVDDRPSTGFLVLETAGCLGLIMALVAMLGERRTLMDVMHFVVPLAALAAVLLWCEWREGRGSLQTRFRRAWVLLGPFAAGAIAPVGIFLVPFITTGSLDSFANGVFGALERRFGQAERPLPEIGDMVWALPYGAALVAVALGRHARWSLVAASAAALALLAGLATIDEPSSYLALWNSVRFLPLFVMLAGCVLLLARPLAVSSPKREQAFLLLLVLAAIGMVQFPFSAPIYFSYTAPMLALAAVPVASLGARPLHLTILLGYLAFAVISLNVGYAWNIGVVHQAGYAVTDTRPLTRSRLRIPPDDAFEYLGLVSAIRTRIRTGEYVFATPDCPEVYFLSGTRNPTGDLYEFLRGPRRGVTETLELIEHHHINLIVINRAPHFSGPLDPALEMALESRFPHSEMVGRFVVRWRV